MLAARAAILILASLAGCRAPRGSAATSPPPPAPAVADEDDPRCAEGARALIYARQLVLTASLDRVPIGSFARLLPAERARLAELQSQPDLRLTLHSFGSRLAFSLPATHPLGPAELLIVDERRDAVIHYADRNQRQVVPREQLVDLVEGSSQSSTRAGHELELAPVPAEELAAAELPASGTRLRAVRAQIRLRHYPTPERSSSWTLSLALQLLVRDEILSPGTQLPGPALSAALPLLGDDDGLGVLGTLREQVGEPARFTLRVENESKPAGVTPTLRYQVSDQGWVRLPILGFCFRRPGYRDLRGARPERPGLQLIPAASLATLRAAPAGGPLEVHNRSGHTALIYLDGALLGFVSAGARMAFRGIPEGYYRVYARTPTGIRAFGPHDSYVPGPLTLR